MGRSLSVVAGNARRYDNDARQDRISTARRRIVFFKRRRLHPALRRHNRRMNALRRLRLPISALLAIALVCAQLAGLHHRIEHPGSNSFGWPVVIADASADTQDEARNADAPKRGVHHCALYDAATLGDSIGGAVVTFAAPCPELLTAPDFSSAAPHGTAALGFHSRAPPRA